ncbi:MAG TPA: 6-phosphogluconolactonase [Acidimicrobiales bacterium]|nr:6-phosphogluconolactonase [Acidimicrobiales bacterium]
MNGELRVVDDVAVAFSDLVVAAYNDRPGGGFSMALSGGDTARACYESLAARAAAAIDWWQVDFYWGDERCVPPDDPASNQLLGRQALLERVGAANSVHPMRCGDGGVQEYQLLLGEVGELDLVHLGLGPDGHTASLFPGSAALDADPGQLVTLNEDPNGRNPYQRMTLTLAAIARARLVVFTVAGVAKAEAMAAVYRGEDLPASRVKAGSVVWLVDRDAAPV